MTDRVRRCNFSRILIFFLVMFIGWNLFTVMDYPIKFEVNGFQFVIYRDYNRRLKVGRENHLCYLNLWAFSMLVIAHPAS